ncbi:hypothetical protein AVEN_215317-1 [Araneus ventricosus]|uniref:CRAL-TRIO domain-containing protein n=1 Tax=Araneus ventricosus TaxID=182803 RepID=A0A4Y2RJS2_ARAVE|nr:hypothetical protein AVEN_215317-1 [Araneus ventricosus]
MFALTIFQHIAWRKEWEIDSILTEYEPPEVLLKYTSSSFLCFDKEGSIVRIQDFGRADAKGLCNSANKTEMGKFSVYLTELDKASVIKRGGNLRKPIFSPIYDFEDLTYAKAANVKALQCLLYCFKMLIDNYPESVKAVTVINGKTVVLLRYDFLKCFYFNYRMCPINGQVIENVTQNRNVIIIVT